MFTFLTRECAADESERRVDRTPQCHPCRQCRTIPSEMHSNFAEISLKLRLKRPGTVRHTSGNGPASKLRSKTSGMVRHTSGTSGIGLAHPAWSGITSGIENTHPASKNSLNFAQISLNKWSGITSGIERNCSKINVRQGGIWQFCPPFCIRIK